MKTIDRKYITLTEDQVEHYSLTDGSRPVVTTWVATVDGKLSTGESIYLFRTGKTAEEAYRNLEVAVIDQKWEIKV